MAPTLLVAAAVTIAAVPAANASPACAVTPPPRGLQGLPRGGPFSASRFNFGDRKIRVQLWPHARLAAGELPGGGSMATVNRDGSIYAKVGWWRGLPDKLTITGRRLDGPAGPLRADVPEGYGERGFIATALTFPTVGCWKVVGRLGSASLTFTVAVSKVGRAGS